MGSSGSKKKYNTEFSGAPYLNCCDAKRCSAVRHLSGNTVSDNKYLDPITATLRKLTGTQMSIAMTIDETLAKVIAESGWPHAREFSRPMTFCAWSLIPVYPEVLVVTDATKDARFRQNPAVTQAPYLRFYAGAPLLDDANNRVGSLCCIDTVPREIDAEICSLICNFADIVMQKLKGKACPGSSLDGYALVRVDQNKWPLQYTCDVFTQLLGLKQEDTMWAEYCLAGKETRNDSCFKDLIIKGDVFKVNVLRKESQCTDVFCIEFSPAWISDGRRKIGYIERCGSESSQRESTPHFARNLYFAKVSKSELTSSSLTADDVVQQILSGIAACPLPDLVVSTAIAQGGFGTVYQGRLRGAEVAIKIVPVRPDFDSTLEGTLALSLQHENVIKTYDFARASDGAGWFVMELCKGGSLLGAIDKGRYRTKHSFYDGSVDLEKVYITAKEIAVGLKCLHDNGILHGDLNCNNVLLDDECVAKVADFGMSRACLADLVVTESVGTMTHMPAELLLDGLMTKAVDIYSYGVILWEMLTSQRAWAGMRPSAIISNKVNGTRLIWPEAIPDAVKEISEACMTDCRIDRPSIDDVLQTLDSNISRMRRQSVSLDIPDYPVYATRKRSTNFL